MALVWFSYYGVSSPPPPPGTPPFNDTEINTMMTYFLANLNYLNCGSVVAALDANTAAGLLLLPPLSRLLPLPLPLPLPFYRLFLLILEYILLGSYYYHWMRDAALSMRSLLIVNNDSSTLQEKFVPYVQWVLRVQNQPDPNGIDIRTEPKFNIPRLV
jgi:glucoamylase